MVIFVAPFLTVPVLTSWEYNGVSEWTVSAVTCWSFVLSASMPNWMTPGKRLVGGELLINSGNTGDTV